jgi:hypothetical protein
MAGKEKDQPGDNDHAEDDGCYRQQLRQNVGSYAANNKKADKNYN